jgi:hypothetical protein
MEEMYKNVTTISYLFEQVEKNLKYYAERRTTHTRIIHEIISTVKEMSMYKMTIMLVIFLIHIYMLRRFFTNAKLDNSL